MRGIYIGDKKALVSMVWGGKLIVSTNDLSLSPDLIIHGVYDVPLTNYLLKAVKPGDTVFDIGANIGCFTVLLGYLVGREGKVIAYEASPDIVKLLSDNVAMNYLKAQTTIYNKAIYSKVMQVTLYQTERFHGNTSLTKHNSEYFHFFGKEGINQVQIDAEPLDVHLNTLTHIDLVKIDIEGGEYDAFIGMQGLLERRMIGTVVFELNKLMLGDSWLPFYQLLQGIAKSYNAKFYTLTDDGQLVSQNLDILFAHDQVNAVVMKFE